MGRTHTKTDVVVEVVDVVAVGATRVPLIVDEGTAAQHMAFHRSALSPDGDISIIQQTLLKFPAFGGGILTLHSKATD